MGYRVQNIRGPKSRNSVSTALPEKDIDVIQERKDHEPLDGHFRSALETGVQWKYGMSEKQVVEEKV